MSHPHNADRCERFAQALEDMPDDDNDAVLALVSEMGLTRSDFVALDEKPGWFYVAVDGKRVPYERSEWARRLRVVRNDGSNDLFERLGR